MPSDNRPMKFRGEQRALMRALLNRLRQNIAREDATTFPRTGPLSFVGPLGDTISSRRSAIELAYVLEQNLGARACTCHQAAVSQCACQPDKFRVLAGPIDVKRLARQKPPGLVLKPPAATFDHEGIGLKEQDNKILRSRVKVELSLTPGSGKDLTYGKFCGSSRTSFRSDPPIDRVDAVCRDHDICYETYPHRCFCDQAFINGMLVAVMDPKISDTARIYGELALKVFFWKPCWCVKTLFGVTQTIVGVQGKCPI